MGAAAVSVGKDRRTTDPWVRRERPPDQTVLFPADDPATHLGFISRRELRGAIRPQGSAPRLSVPD